MIGIIDSGTGGLNVILECTKYYNEDFVYLLDNKNCPYGNKKVDDLKKILKDNINYLLKNYDLDLIIIACNTISALLDYSVLLNYKIPILKTVPKIKNIKNNGKNILIFATKNTIKYSKELKLIKFNYPNIKTLTIKGFPKIIDNYLSENNVKNNYEINKILNYYFLKNNNFKINNNLDTILYTNKFKSILKKCVNVKPIIYNGHFKLKSKTHIVKNHLQSVEYISLGCTHFKHIKGRLKNLFNGRVKFFECETDVAKVSKWLVRKNKKKCSLELILTKKDQQLENVVYNMFRNVQKN